MLLLQLSVNSKWTPELIELMIIICCREIAVHIIIPLQCRLIVAATAIHRPIQRIRRDCEDFLPLLG